MYTTENISLIRANTDIKDYDSGKVNQWESQPFANLFYAYLQDSAGSNSMVSLTLDILNKDELVGKSFPNEKWLNEKRQRGSLIETEPIWGFIETSHATKLSSAIGNAFCFADQELIFHIATEGGGVGYIGDQWLYCKNTVNISYLNVINGDTGVILSFDRFDTPLDDDSRYASWTVPSQNTGAFTDYGLMGMIVIRVDVTNEYFLDARLEIPYEGAYPNKNMALLHLLTYSASKELNDVTQGGIDLLNTPVSQYANLNNIFSHTIFADFESLNQNLLTDDQKRAIVADQVAVLFMSQHPVLTADYYPSKILGYGMTRGIQAETIIQKAATYSERFPDIYTLAKDRLFGMIASVERFNFAKEIEDMFDNYAQSNQLLRDPARIILTDDNGILSDDMGVNGILFNPYVADLVSAEILFDVPAEDSLTYDISIEQGSIAIDNLKLTRHDGTSLRKGDKHVLMSFRVLAGEERITRIRYTLWTKNDLNHLEAVDNYGYSRSRAFEIEIDDDSSEGNDIDTVFARLDIEDVDSVVHVFYAEQLIYGSEAFPGVTLMGASQRSDGSGMVDIYYDYFGRSEINNTKVSVQLSENGVNFTEISSDNLRGDIGTSIMPGQNHIVWYPYLTYSSDYPSSVIFKMSLTDIDGYEDSNASSNIIILDLDAPEVVLRKVNMEDESEAWDSSSSTQSQSSSSSSSSWGNSSSSSSRDSSSSSIGEYVGSFDIFAKNNFFAEGPYLENGIIYKLKISDKYTPWTDAEFAAGICQGTYDGYSHDAFYRYSIPKGDVLCSTPVPSAHSNVKMIRDGATVESLSGFFTGSYTKKHNYTIFVEGQGANILLRIEDSETATYLGNKGKLTVEVFV
ncbi:MAG: hypothetical protein WC119_02115 [Synergistaceae bacterium]